jgi:hypothetical protein
VPTPVQLAEFDPPVATAVVTVLRRAGLPASLAGSGTSADEVAVMVPAECREEALAAMASSMEAIRDELARSRAGGRRAVDPAHGGERDRPVTSAADAHDADDADDELHRPLLFERLRSLGFLPVLLVPLLVVTLSQTRLPAIYAVAVIVGGGLVIVAWRDGRRRRGD